ncbi:hypothetical protein AQ490_17130 [Wenjunlia vitaminophila]|uniref:Cell division protein FtsQ n=1 Tax=Wenjunlia vitaminophila TaxID=76728 RepID=A0A0T6LW07_WENVI|nr:hypothetical protein AQ490_17130 [Wenjunlia vitaminophila]
MPGHDAPAPPPAGSPPRAVRSRRRLLVLLLVLTLLGGGGVWVVYGTSLFEVREVRVTGTEALAPSRVREVADISPGGPLAAVDTSAVARRLRGELPRIERVEVERSWPHTVLLKVTERRPAVVLRRGAGFTEVDRRGVGYATVERPPAGVPLVNLAPRRQQDSSGRGRTALLRASARVAAALPEEVRGQVKSIDVRSYDEIRLRLSGKRTVVWGSPEGRDAKRGALLALMKAVPDATRYDVSAPSAPAAAR